MDNQFFFAWVDADTPFDPVAHAREDAEVVSFECMHEEANFAALNITIRNPRVGLLAPGRKQWAWLSWRHKVDGVDTVTPLFYGRLVAVPDSIIAEAVTLAFTARPSDYNARKAAVADALRVLPYYDPIWIAEDQRANPDVVLEAYSRVWHIDRVTHEVTTTDIIVAEDGIEDFGGGAGERDEVPYSTVALKLEQAPLRRIAVDGAVNWSQVGAGTLTLFDGTVESFTGDALISSWPKTDGNIGGGWKVVYADVRDMDGIGALDDNTWVQGQYSGTTTTRSGVPTPNPFARSDIPPGWLFKKALEWSFMLSYSLEGVLVPKWRVGGTIRVGYEAERNRTEHARFTLTSDLQAIIADPGDDEVMTLAITADDVGIPIDGVIPIGNVGRREYFTTERGLQSLEYLIARARSALLHRARAVKVEFACRFERAIALSCRKNARLFDRRLPGGEALGKIVAYSFAANVTAGLLIGSVTTASAVGYGGAYIEQPGDDPVYVAEGYVKRGYQRYENVTTVIGAGDVAYAPPTNRPIDDGWDFTKPVRNKDAVLYFEHTPSIGVQEKNLRDSIITAGVWSDPKNKNAARDSMVESAKAALKKYPTVITYKLKPVTGGPFNTDYDIAVEDLIVPAQINLEAPPSP